MLTKQIPDTLPKPQLETRPDMRADVIVIGAGPTGLACAIEAQKAGLKVISLDKGCLVNSIFHYPANMIFFTTPELLEIGDIPFSTANPKPNRLEALEYYRKARRQFHTIPPLRMQFPLPRKSCPDRPSRGYEKSEF